MPRSSPIPFGTRAPAVSASTPHKLPRKRGLCTFTCRPCFCLWMDGLDARPSIVQKYRLRYLWASTRALSSSKLPHVSVVAIESSPWRVVLRSVHNMSSPGEPYCCQGLDGSPSLVHLLWRGESGRCQCHYCKNGEESRGVCNIRAIPSHAAHFHAASGKFPSC